MILSITIFMGRKPLKYRVTVQNIQGIIAQDYYLNISTWKSFIHSSHIQILLFYQIILLNRSQICINKMILFLTVLEVKTDFETKHILIFLLNAFLVTFPIFDFISTKVNYWWRPNELLFYILIQNHINFILINTDLFNLRNQTLFPFIFFQNIYLLSRKRFEYLF